MTPISNYKSGTLLDKKDSEPSLAVITVEPMVLLLFMMSLIKIVSEMFKSGYKRLIDMLVTMYTKFWLETNVTWKVKEG